MPESRPPHPRRWLDPLLDFVNHPLVRFITRRLIHALLILLAVSFLTFILMNLTPGDFLTGKSIGSRLPKDFFLAERARLGLDQPWLVRYGLWLKGIVTGLNFGFSFKYDAPVFEVMWPPALRTLLLSFSSLVLAWLIAIPLGILAGARQYSWTDRLSSLVAFIGVSFPEVFLALLAMYFAAETDLFPRGRFRNDVLWSTYTTGERILNVARHLVLPTVVLSVGMLAGYMRQMRGNLLDVLSADYIRTARAKGLREGAVLYRHAVRNAINPLITLFGFSFSGLLSGAVLVENVMDYGGLGQQTLEALKSEDTYLVMANLLVATLMLVLGNLLADLLLVWSDPRIKLETRSTAG